MKRIVLIQPFLFALSPILSFYSDRKEWTSYTELFAPLLAATAATLVVLIVAVAIFRDLERAAAMTSILWILFFFLRPAVETSKLLGQLATPLGGLVMVGFLVPLISAAVLLARRPRQYFADVLTVVALALISLQVVALGPWFAHLARVRPQAQTFQAVSPAATATRPDIYHIILDSYARSDVLEDLFQYDNRWFLDALEERGFIIASESTSNYSQTDESVPSILNSVYVNDVVEPARGMEDLHLIRGMIHGNSAATFLKALGYTYVAFSTGYLDEELKDADVYRASSLSLGPLQSELVNATPLTLLTDQYDMYRDRILYAFDHVPEAATMKKPVFVVAHIMSPHPPFVFGADGERRNPESPPTFANTVAGDEYVEQYRAQLAFVSKRTVQMVDHILAQSPEPPIIIVQGDHGSGLGWDMYSADNTDLWERMSILNAYRFPGGKPRQLSMDVTPVNSYRILFNNYFGTSIPLLSNRNYFVPFTREFGFTDVTDRIARR